MLHLSSGITKQEWTEQELRYWKEILTPYSPELIEWAFKDYLRTAEFNPKPKHILERIVGKIAEANRHRYERATVRELAELEKRRREHPEEFFGLADLATAVPELKIVPTIDLNQRQAELQAQKVALTHPETQERSPEPPGAITGHSRE